MTWECNLCGMEFPNKSEGGQPTIEYRKGIHEGWHQHCKVQKRNTTEGKVEWIQK